MRKHSEPGTERNYIYIDVFQFLYTLIKSLVVVSDGGTTIFWVAPRGGSRLPKAVCVCGSTPQPPAFVRMRAFVCNCFTKTLGND